MFVMGFEKQDAQEDYESAHRNFNLALQSFARIIWSHDELIHELSEKHHLDIDLAIMELYRRNRQVSETLAVLESFEDPLSYDDVCYGW